MKVVKPLLVASFVAFAALGLNDRADAQQGGPDKWTGKQKLSEFTYDFPASSSFSVEVGAWAPGGQQGNIFGVPTLGGRTYVRFTGPGTISSPQLSPPHADSALRLVFAGWDYMAATTPMCVQLAVAHAALPASSPRHLRVKFNSSTLTSDQLLSPYVELGQANTVSMTCSEQ